MHAWQTDYDRKSFLRSHTVENGGHALLAPLFTTLFRDLHVSAAIWEHGNAWWSIHHEPNISAFEAEHSVDTDRVLYNQKAFAEVQRLRTSVVAQHWGYSDLFVPILLGGQVAGILVTGPFLTARPTAAQILDRFRKLMGRNGHLADPTFAEYFRTSLATLVLEPNQRTAFEKFVGCLSQLMSGDGDAGALATQAEVLTRELLRVRQAERMWGAARSMVGDSSWRIWHGAGRRHDLGDLGLARVPDHVLVGIAAGDRTSDDPVEHAVRCVALQRAVVELSVSLEQTISACVGEQGVALLCAGGGSASKKKQRLSALSQRLLALSRRYGIALRCGASLGSAEAPLSRVYQSALRASETASLKGSQLAFAEPDWAGSTQSLKKLRDELGKAAKVGLEGAALSFEHYLEAVSQHSGDRIEAAVVHLEAGFERLTEPLAERGVLERRSLTALSDSLERSAREAESMLQLLAAYRRAAADVVAALTNPVAARHDRSIRGAVEYIREHYAEPLRLHQVARLAGVAPSHFSRLFSEHEGMPFERFVSELRLGRARQLLSGSALSIARIAELCGFNSSQYFARAFRRSQGVSPLVFRRKLGKLRPASLTKTVRARA